MAGEAKAVARLAVASAFCCGLATAAAAQPLSPAARFPLYDFYVGAGAFYAHHTGYVPGTPFNAEVYKPGVKVYAGYTFNRWIGVEAAYHYLGEASFAEGFAVPSREHSHSFSATGLVYMPLIAESVLPTRMFFRGGFAYKDITHVAAVGTFNEGVASWVAGFGFEFQLTSRVFARLEYEFVSRGIGGTDRAINVMHTPLSASLGVRF